MVESFSSHMLYLNYASTLVGPLLATMLSPVYGRVFAPGLQGTVWLLQHCNAEPVHPLSPTLHSKRSLMRSRTLAKGIKEGVKNIRADILSLPCLACPGTWLAVENQPPLRKKAKTLSPYGDSYDVVARDTRAGIL
ncbi:hypothetical protein QBC40DRAFT_301614 [Triangularia verruculosa]|uniref:Uncharacterized protein n=1 Tax=Triangularia verruculosa TaxID=2587418 RepID=A0AAN7AQQ0_9PEZI|nr:hypothetical protein QBC40DRAFT_301614 [Triangularia verruculosa]